MFLLPPYKGCELGYREVTFHEFLEDTGRKSSKGLCLLKHPTPDMPADEAPACYSEDFLEAVADHQHLLTPTTLKLLSKLPARTQVMFPVAIWAAPGPAAEGEFPDWHVSESPTGAVFVIENRKLLEKISQIEEDDKLLRDWEEGRRLQFQRSGNQMDIRAIGGRRGEAQPPEVRALWKDAPNIDSYYKKAIMNYKEMERLLGKFAWVQDILEGGEEESSGDDSPPFDVDPPRR
jgi:hypothetical protein